jgi:arginyl-tRNA synthetase
MIRDRIGAALDGAGYGGSEVPVILERPRQKQHGDIATPIALSLAKAFKKNPMAIAEELAAKLEFPEGEIEAIDIAKPGYLNLRVAHKRLVGNLADVRSQGDEYGRQPSRGIRCQIEYVSANPTGPLVIVSARAAAVGSVLVNLLRAVGFDAEGEYYVNDYGNQVDALGESVRFRLREQNGKLADGEEIGAYPGAYLKDIAARIPAETAAEWESSGATDEFGRFATEQLLQSIQADLELFGVHFDNFFRESSLHPQGVADARKLVEDKGYAYTADGAVYFKTTDFGDEKDRVIVKSDGKATYFLGDIAYHFDKYRRGHQWVVDLLGPDHHGHVPRMKAAAAVIGAGEDWFDALIVGWVRLLEGGKPVSMSKRAGEIITMRELIDDVGADVAKYFFLMRRANSPLDFDLDLARKQSDENPVYYVQYAHARISSVARFAEKEGLEMPEGSVRSELLETPEERELMVHLMFFPQVIEGAALSREPHRMTSYSQELATLFHRFYHERRIVTDDKDLSSARLYLVQATKQVLRNALTVMGVDAPSSM